jgi:hypothetical protein
MAPDATNPARGEAPGLGKSSCLGADDGRVSTILPYRNQAVDRARRRYLVAKLHAVRPAPFAYLLREIEAGADVRVTLEAYAKLDPKFIRAHGGDRFAPSLHVIDRGRR